MSQSQDKDLEEKIARDELFLLKQCFLKEMGSYNHNEKGV